MSLDSSQSFPVGSDPAQSQAKPATVRRPGTILSAALAMPTIPPRHPSARIADYLRRLMQDHFYGKVTVTLRDGRIEVIRTEQSLKLVDVQNAPGVTTTVLEPTAAVDGGNA